MAIGKRLKWYLDHHGAAYEIIPHVRTESSRQTAEVAHVDEARLAKCVLLEDERGYVLAVVPASRRIRLVALEEQLGRKLDLASETELGQIFDDCELGAVPPLGAAYGIPTAVDDHLLHLPDVYFEAGDHADLVHMTGADFAGLLSGCPHGVFSDEDWSGAHAPSVRARPAREGRLDEARAHVFSLRAFGAGLRGQPEYEKDGHTGMILVKTPELRVVLEAVQPGTVLATHVVHGPATVYVLEGALDVRTDGRTLRVGEAEMAVLPRDEQREIAAAAPSLFVLALSPDRARAARAESGETQRARRILIVANRTAGGEHLLEAVRKLMDGGPCEFVVLCPASPSRRGFTWAARDARSQARDRVDKACAGLRRIGARVEGVVGDVYPMRAVRDILLVDEFDEIIVSTLPVPASEWLKLDLPSRIARRFGLPVAHLASSE